MSSENKRQLRTGRVGVAELTALLTIYTATDVFLSYPARVAAETATSAWMIPLVSGAVVLAAFLIMHACMRRFPDHDILQLADRFLTPYVALPLTLLFVAFLFLQTALTMREFTETVVTTVLPATPAVLIALLLLLVSLYYAHKGLEGLTRVAVLLSVVFAVGLAALLLLPMTWFDARLLLPFVGRGIAPTLYYGVLNSSMFLNVLMLAVTYKSVRNQQHFLRAGTVSIVVTAVLMSLVVVVYLGTFGSAPTGRTPFPLYQLARLIYVGRFVQRMEAVFVFLWVAAAVVKMGCGLWFTAYLYAAAFRMPVYRPLLYAIALSLFIISFLPPDLMTVQALSSQYVERYGWIVTVAIPVSIVATAYIIDRVKQASSQRRARGAREVPE